MSNWKSYLTLQAANLRVKRGLERGDLKLNRQFHSSWLDEDNLQYYQAHMQHWNEGGAEPASAENILSTFAFDPGLTEMLTSVEIGDKEDSRSTLRYAASQPLQ